MEIVQLTLGALGTNCYLVKREEGVLVIDPAAEPGRIASNLRLWAGSRTRWC